MLLSMQRRQLNLSLDLELLDGSSAAAATTETAATTAFPAGSASSGPLTRLCPTTEGTQC
jgi:hypothetical protein